MYSLIVVDDEKSASCLTAHYIESENLGFCIAGIFQDGMSAWKYLQQNKVDVVITDIRMPHMSGLQLAKNIFETKLKTTVILLSGYGEFSYAQEGIRYGIADYLLKPIDLEKLSQLLFQIKLRLEERDWKEEHFDATLHLFQEQFLIDIYSGQVSDPKIIERKLMELNFPENFIVRPGCVALFSVDAKTKNLSDYNEEKIEMILFQILKLSLQDSMVYLLAHDEAGLRYLIVYTGNKQEKPSCFSREALEQYVYINDNIDFHLIQLSDIGSLMDVVSMAQSQDKINENNIAALQENNAKVILEKALKYIECNFSKNISREDVANFVYLNPSYFGRYFKQHTGDTFTEYLSRYRMNKAIKLLEENLSVSTISDKIGYVSVRHFIRVFKAYTGYTPKEYRIHILNRDPRAHDE